MDYVIGILREILTRLECAWTEFVTSGKVSENSPTAKQKAKEMDELKKAIKILTTSEDTGENTCNLHDVRFSEKRAEVCLKNGSYKNCPTYLAAYICLKDCTLHKQT